MVLQTFFDFFLRGLNGLVNRGIIRFLLSGDLMDRHAVHQHLHAAPLRRCEQIHGLLQPLPILLPDAQPLRCLMVGIGVAFIVQSIQMIRRVVTFPPICVPGLPVVLPEECRGLLIDLHQDDGAVCQFVLDKHVRSFPPETERAGTHWPQNKCLITQKGRIYPGVHAYLSQGDLVCYVSRPLYVIRLRIVLSLSSTETAVFLLF